MILSGASIHFSGGGAKVREMSKFSACSTRKFTVEILRAERRKIENCVCLVVFLGKMYSFVVPYNAF